jgi:hypothetical protein
VVARVLERDEINLSFRRNIENPEILEWDELVDTLGEVQLNNTEDTSRWCPTKVDNLQ